MADECLRFDWIIEYIAQLPLKSLSDPATGWALGVTERSQGVNKFILIQIATSFIIQF